MKENESLVENFSLKKENNELLISKDYINVYEKSKCFASKKIKVLINNGEDYDVYSKLYFVKGKNNRLSNLVNSIKGVDIKFKQDKESYKNNFFYLSIYLDNFGKKYLSEISEDNIGKKLYTANDSKFISSMNIKERITNGIYISGNLFEENWQELYALVKFEVFKNSLPIQ